MKTNEVLDLIGDKEFLDKIYQFSYRRCNTSFEAEDLCSDIILAVISAVNKQDSIENFYAFVWKIAHRTYADYCEKKNRSSQIISFENSELALVEKENEIEDFIEEMAVAEQLNKVFSEIAFLSKAYREVMIMYYIDERKIKDIASILGINETTVKQRLFSARNIVRKEVQTMNNRQLSLKPIKLAMMGTGNPCGNDPRDKAERVFSQNLIYLCKDKPKSAKELSDELCVPMPFIEDELEIQCHGGNGEYGMLRKLDNGKYAINILLVDYEEYDQANKIYEKHLPELCSEFKKMIEMGKEKILSFPYLSTQNDIRFIMWSMFSDIVHGIELSVNKVIAEKYFSDITPVDRAFTCVAVAYTDDQQPVFDFWGRDGIDATLIGDYKSVFISNAYGTRMDKHFGCGHNMSQDEKLLMTIRAIGGLEIDSLTETEKEIAAKAIECGYLRKNENILEPKIIVIDKKDTEAFYYSLFGDFDFSETMGIVEEIAKELSDFMKKHIPEHLMQEYQNYSQLIAGIRILSKMIEECIKEGLLTEPTDRICAEGVLMIVEK